MEKKASAPVPPAVIKDSLTPEPILTPPLMPEHMVKQFPKSRNAKLAPVIAFVVMILLGTTTGWVLAKKQTSTSDSPAAVTTKNSVNKDDEAGINDEEAFPDTAIGILKEGPWLGEGTHHLDRSATKEKEVSLSSTIINLDNFVDKKVEIRGQTISGKSGWLMDVGKIKVAK